MTFLAIDVGNSRLKWALYAAARPGAALLAHGVEFLDHIERLADGQWADLPAPTHMLGCVVAGDAVKRRVAEQMDLWDVPARWVVPSAEEAGVVNGYDHPSRLGADRWVAMIGARHHLLAQGPALVERARAAGNAGVELRTRYLLVNASIINAPDYSPVELYEPIACAAEKAGDMLLALTIRATHGNSLRNIGRPAEAEAVLRRCIEAARAAGHRHIGGIALGYLGHVFNQTDRFDEALQTYDECLRIMREVGDLRFIAIFMSSRGTLLRKLKRLDESLTHYDQAQGLLRELGALEDLANVLMGRAMVEFARGHERGWRAACAESEAISNQLNQPQRAEMSRLKLAELKAQQT